MARLRPPPPSLGEHAWGLLVLLVAILLFADTPVSGKDLVATDGQTGDTDYTCSATKPCAIGCCSKDGICGMGPDYCSSANCINSCNAKSECDPANWGSQYASSEKCPLNVCCSKYGFCGTTEEFCGSTQIANPSCPGGKSATQRTVGYYEGWGVGRACDAMLPEQIPVAAYTHINFAFAMIDPTSFAVAPMSDGDVALYSRLTGLKALFPDLKVFISIGGWSMNDPDQPTATTFSDVAGSTANQQRFFASLIAFMSEYGFDGVDIDWEYPVAPERSGRPEDYQNYPTFLRNLRSAFQSAGKSWGLTITMPSSFWYMQHFDIVNLEPLVDWFNMMEYDIHGTWDATSVWAGAYVAAHTNLTEIDQSLKLLWRNGINPSKVVLGLGFYGRSYTLESASCNVAGCPFTSGAPGGPCTDSVGTLSYGEIQRLIAAGAKPVLDKAAAVQTLTYSGNNWVSYDDQTTLQMKIDYANNNCLGGTMVWAASLDDAAGSAATALTGASGITIGPKGTRLGIAIPDNPGLCTWTSCGQGCPGGTTAAAYVLDGCPQPTSSPFNYRLFCCPSNDVPDCNYHMESVQGGNCVAGSCPAGTELLTTTQFILVPFQLCPAGGHVNWCCSTSSSLTKTLGQCSWTECGGTCPSGTTQMTQSLTGDGGEQPCTSGWRNLCCPSGGTGGFAASTCQWYQNAYHGTCTPGCPQGKVQLAVDSAGARCVRGFGSFCCDPPGNTLATRSDPQMQAFEQLVHSFITSGTCAAHTEFAIPRQLSSRSSSIAIPTSHDMAVALAPILYQWAWSTSSRAYLTPFQEIWDDEVGANGNAFPTFATLALAYTNYNPVEGTAIDYLDDELCLGTDGIADIDDDMAASSHLCQLVSGPTGGVARRDVGFVGGNETSRVEGGKRRVRETLGKRWFIGMWKPGSSTDKYVKQPATGDALSYLGMGTMRPEYFRFFRYQRNEIEMEAVFLLGPQPSTLIPTMQEAFYRPNREVERFAIVHVHFNAQGLINNNLAINQMNIRHGLRIRAAEEPPLPGRYTTDSIDPVGQPIFVCPDQATGLDGWTTATPGGIEGELILELIQILRRWGERGNLFGRQNPDPSTLQRVESGPNSGQLVVDGNGDPLSMFNVAEWARGRNGIAFAPDGSLYDPFTRNGGDIVNTEGFYVARNGPGARVNF